MRSKIIFLCMASLFPLMFIAASCKLTPSQVEDKVQQSIQEEFSGYVGPNAISPDSFRIIVSDVQLIHRGGNEYFGFIYFMSDDGEYEEKRNIEVIYDGYSMHWELGEVEY